MQHARYSTTNELYQLALKVRPTDGELHHARCASFLERGQFEKANKMWIEASNICTPSHNGITLHVQKQRAYDKGVNFKCDGHDDDDGTIYNLSFITLIPSKCFVTKPENPTLSKEECRQAFEWAEDAAKARGEGGWTTPRHYAVPTTDIPIHDVPPLLKWFNQVLKYRLRPLLALQYGEEEVGEHGQNVNVHDAFIVRYDALGGQKHLPLHRDQSSHSFTIALNSLTEYRGGGAYMHALEKGRALRPDRGGELSFRGDQLLPSGDPVGSGRRYIVVAFCYVCERVVKNPKTKKMRIETQFQKGNRDKTFSFRFL